MPVKTHDIAVILNGANRVQLFAVGAHSGQVYTCELSDQPHGNWQGGPWSFMGGPSDTLQLAVARNTNGLLELFALKSDGRVWHNKQTAATFYQSWGQWADIGAIDWKQIIIGTNADGRLEVFALVNGGQVFHLWQESPAGAWSGTGFFSGTGWKDLAVGPNSDGRLELFAIGADNSGYHQWQLVPNGGWSDWVHLGGVSWKELTVIPNPDGRLELFILADGNAWHMWQIPLTGDHCQAYVDAVKNAQQHLKAVLNDPDHTPAEFKAAEQAVTNAENALKQCRANPPLVGWSGSVAFGAHDLRQIAVARNADGRLELFGLGGDSSIYHIWMTAVNNGWRNEWSNLNVAAQQFWVVLDEEGRLVVLYTGNDGLIHVIGQVVPNGNWTTPHPAWLSDPEPKPAVTLTANLKEIKKGQSTTLSWTSSYATNLSIDQGIGPVTLPSGSHVVTPPFDITYTITATALGGTATDTQHITVDQPPPPPPPGVSAVPYFNCTDQVLHFWLLDQTAGTAWKEVGTLSSQKDQFGGCPASGAQPLVVSLPAAHAYQIVAVMPSECGGANDPTNLDCRRYVTQLIGDPKGTQAAPINVS